ncbi:hypothetical protein [Siansivirga zeaxanthinifaciens]|uniref:Alpha-ketoglutarate decarboxylase n=1 Tax=Siansivirga zeaxanthinifaciens CC-SAMT-1 TaxID=1454006 RepID=A0A0C5WCW0_9FLAO|nr:hypothetical protein [Siansivirga zeaxanthinifaciens]AJR03114.1 alpha-ketoglutarate decarboxylase [Siansivirga zeaxanthinifaciens CC-SAMT-1]
MNKIKTFFLLLFLSVFNFFHAQQVKNEFWNHVRFGGGIGLSFGDGFFSGTLAPSVIYEFNNTLALGAGLNGTLNKQKDFYKSTILGGSLIGLYSPIMNIQLSAEYEQLHVNRTYDNQLNLANDNYWSPALFLGLGYRNGNATLGVRYDILYDNQRSVYANAWAPFVRFYF